MFFYHLKFSIPLFAMHKEHWELVQNDFGLQNTNQYSRYLPNSLMFLFAFV